MKRIALALVMLAPLLALAAGPTIQQIKASQPESLWAYLAQLPGSLEAQIFYALMLAGIAGMLANYLRLWTSGASTGSPWHYFFVNEPRRTVMSLMTFTGACAGAILTGYFFTEHSLVEGDIFIGWKNVLIDGFTVGLGGDATFNRAKQDGGALAPANPSVAKGVPNG